MAAWKVPVLLSVLCCSFCGIVSAWKHFKCSDVDEITVDQIQNLFFHGKLTSVELVRCYLQRVRDYSDPGTFNPKLARYPANAIIEINKMAIRDAARKDLERRAKCSRARAPACLGPLHGVPVLLKDNIAADGMHNTAGSYALVGCRHAEATLAAKVRAAGAVILGKAGLSEWANFRSYHSVSGWSGIGGQVLNPYTRYILTNYTIVPSPYKGIPSAVKPGTYTNIRNPEVVSGSSSGSAVAATLNLAAVTVGTETDGSILSPGANNGVVGIKPTVGLVSRHGVVPISSWQDTAGPMCRTVADAVYLLDAMYGPDPNDVATVAQIGLTPSRGYAEFLKTGALKGARIAAVGYAATGFSVLANPGILDAALVAKYYRMIERLRALGATVDVYPYEDAAGSIIPGFKMFYNNLLTLLGDFKQDISTYLLGCEWEKGQQPLRTLGDLITFNKKHPKEEFQGGRCCRGQIPYGNFFQEIFEDSEVTSGLDDPAFLETKYNQSVNSQAFYRFLHGNNSAGRQYDAWMHIGDFIDAFAQARWPSITVPWTTASTGLPVGVMFSSTAFTEPALIRIAYDFEQRARGGPRPLPKYCDLNCANEGRA